MFEDIFASFGTHYEFLSFIVREFSKILDNIISTLNLVPDIWGQRH